MESHPRTQPKLQLVGGRDPFLDVIRTIAMCAVVLNHYTFTLVSPAPTGAGAQLEMLQTTDGWVTWPFIWELPAFFVAAGALSFVPATRSSTRAFIGKRLWRILIPLIPFVVVLWIGEQLTTAAGDPTCVSWTSLEITCTTAVALAPMWFVLVILALTVMTPWLARRWSVQFGCGVVIAALAFMLAMDVIRWKGGGALPLSEVAVWTIPWLAGFAYANGDLAATTRRQLLVVAVAGTALIAAMMGFGFYPNFLATSPRTVVTGLEQLVGVAVLLLVRDWLIQLADRPTMQRAISVIGDRLMGVFVWHYFAFGIVTITAVRAGWALAERPGLDYLAQRVVLIPIALALTAFFVVATRRFERVPMPEWITGPPPDASSQRPSPGKV